MRSVVVVLPASMCAMMPMLRTFLRSVVMSTATGGFPLRVEVVGRRGLRAAGSRRAWVSTRMGPAHPLLSKFGGPGIPLLPAVVGEGAVRLGHLVGVLATLHRGTETVGGVEDLVHEP